MERDVVAAGLLGRLWGMSAWDVVSVEDTRHGVK